MDDDEELRQLHRRLLDAWNAHDAEGMGRWFDSDGVSVGFDGSEAVGRAAISAAMEHVFRDHRTATFVAIVRSVRMLGPSAGLLRAVAGMVRSGDADITPAMIAASSLVAVRVGGAWRTALTQNMPTQYHGRPEAAAALSDGLRGAWAAQRV